MEDFEIRQAFSIIQDRIQEIKQDQDWKQKIVEEWNEAHENEQKDAAQRQLEVFGPEDKIKQQSPRAS